jgi:hypothetical protein
MSNLTDNKKIDLISIKLDKIKFGFKAWLTKQALNDCNVELILDQIQDRYLIEMKGFFAGEHVSDHFISYPKDWWQAFKDRWFPKWLKWKYPIKLSVHKFEYKVIYDNFKVSLPKESYKMVVNEKPIMDEESEISEGSAYASRNN